MYKNNLAPIALFCYNRPYHTLKTLKYLSNNAEAKNSVLYVFQDGLKEGANEKESKKHIQTKKIIQTFKKNFLCINYYSEEKNIGLRKNITNGINKVLSIHDCIIVLEDDIKVNNWFLKYMNEALSLYSLNDSVMHVSAYIFPGFEKLPTTYFYNQTNCWGWGTWKRAWAKYIDDVGYLVEKLESRNQLEDFNLHGARNYIDDLKKNQNGNLNTWAIRWHTSVYLEGGLCLHPNKSLVENIGFDGSGTHGGKTKKFITSIASQPIKVKKVTLKENLTAKNLAINYFLNQNKGLKQTHSIIVFRRLENLMRKIKVKIFILIYTQ